MDNTVHAAMNLRKFALIAGISLLIMALAAAFSYGFVHGSLIEEADISTTVRQLSSSSGLFKAGIFGWLIILLSDIVCAWAMYLYMKPDNRYLSLLGAWLRLGYAAILGIAILNLLYESLLTTEPQYAQLLTEPQLQAQVLLSLEAFESIWSLGLIVFGGHLLVIAIVAFQSPHIPRVISILLFIAAVSYLLTHLSSSFFGQYDEINTVLEMILTVPMTVGELGFGLWLLFRGGRQHSLFNSA